MDGLRYLLLAALPQSAPAAPPETSVAFVFVYEAAQRAPASEFIPALPR